MAARSSRASGGGVRPGLIAALIVLILLVAALVLFLVWASRPLGAPTTDAELGGLTWVRSIYGYGDAPEQQFTGPTDVAVAPDGTIWATDPGNRRVLGFGPDGTFVALIQPAGVDPPEAFIQPEGVGVDDDGNVFVADFGLGRIVQFTSEGEFVRQWDVPNPLDVDARDGRIAVSTVYGVAVFDRQGELLDKWGRRGPADDEFDIAHGIALGENGTMYVSDTQNSRVKALDADGELLWLAPPEPSSEESEGAEPFQLPSGMAIDGGGRIVLADPFEFALMVVDPADGSVIDSFGEEGASDGQFFYPTGVAYDEARDWFVVADTTNRRLQVVRIPGSGGGVLEAATRAMSGPGWLWVLPPAFLLAAIVLTVLARRRVPAVADSGGATSEES